MKFAYVAIDLYEVDEDSIQELVTLDNNNKPLVC